MFESISISYNGEMAFFEFKMRNKRIKVKISEEKCTSADMDLLYSGIEEQTFDVDLWMIKKSAFWSDFG